MTACVAAAMILVACDGASGHDGILLRMKDDVVLIGETPILELTNRRPQPIGYGYPYELERRRGEHWEIVRVGCLFILPLLSLPRGDSYEQEIELCRGMKEVDLEPGTYRVSKDVVVDYGPPETRAVVAATFTVTDG